jgi:hypothetical protein
MHNDIYRLTHNITKEVICVGTQKEVVNYMIERVQEACEQTKESLAKKIKIALHNGTLLFRKYEIAEDQPVKHIAPNKHSVPSQYLQTVTLNNARMLKELKVLENLKRRFPNPQDNAIKQQEENIEKLKHIPCIEFSLKWNEKANRYDKV